MRLIGIEVLDDFVAKCPEVKGQIGVWRLEVEAAAWRTPQDIKQRYPSASLLHQNIVVFNIKGNRFRLAVQVAFQTGACIVLKVGSHAEYDKWNL